MKRFRQTEAHSARAHRLRFSSALLMGSLAWIILTLWSSASIAQTVVFCMEGGPPPAGPGIRCGTGAVAGLDGTAVGVGAVAPDPTGSNPFAVGASAFGFASNASGDSATALGAGAFAKGFGTAVGGTAFATGFGATAL